MSSRKARPHDVRFAEGMLSAFREALAEVGQLRRVELGEHETNPCAERVFVASVSPPEQEAFVGAHYDRIAATFADLLVPPLVAKYGAMGAAVKVGHDPCEAIRVACEERGRE